MGQLAVSYGANAIPAMGGSPDLSRIKHKNSAVPAIGSGASLPTESVVDRHTGCAGMTKVGEPCRARKANGTDWCVGHLRSRGEL